MKLTDADCVKYLINLLGVGDPNGGRFNSVLSSMILSANSTFGNVWLTVQKGTNSSFCQSFILFHSSGFPRCAASQVKLEMPLQQLQKQTLLPPLTKAHPAPPCAAPCRPAPPALPGHGAALALWHGGHRHGPQHHRQRPSRSKCHASSNKKLLGAPGLTSSNKKLLEPISY